MWKHKTQIMIKPTNCWILTMCLSLFKYSFLALWYYRILIIGSSFLCSLYSKLLCNVTWIKQDAFLPKVFMEVLSVTQTAFWKGEIEGQRVKTTIKFRYHSQSSWSQGKSGKSRHLLAKPDIVMNVWLFNWREEFSLLYERHSYGNNDACLAFF